MENKKLTLYVFGLVYAITLGSLVYIVPKYKELWLFLEITVLPFIYIIGFEIILHHEKRKKAKNQLAMQKKFLKMQKKIERII